MCDEQSEYECAADRDDDLIDLLKKAPIKEAPDERDVLIETLIDALVTLRRDGFGAAEKKIDNALVDIAAYKEKQ